MKSTDGPQIVDDVYNKFKSNSLVFLKDKIGQPIVNHKERTIEIQIPYTEHADLFNLKPSSFINTNPIKGVIYGMTNCVTVSINDSDDIQKNLNNLDKHIDDISKQCDDFNIDFEEIY